MKIVKFKFLRAQHLRLGKLGEKIACRLLRQKHFDILCHNYKSLDRHGEADIVARDGAVLCFVEVKTRRRDNRSKNDDTSLLGHRQAERIKHAALDYMNKIKCKELIYRFDLVEIIMSGRIILDVRHWQNSFGE